MFTYGSPGRHDVHGHDQQDGPNGCGNEAPIDVRLLSNIRQSLGKADADDMFACIKTRGRDFKVSRRAVHTQPTETVSRYCATNRMMIGGRQI